MWHPNNISSIIIERDGQIRKNMALQMGMSCFKTQEIINNRMNYARIRPEYLRAVQH